MAQPVTSLPLQPDQAEFYRTLLERMLRLRRFEEKAGEAYAQGKIGGFCHLYIGQEAVATGAIAALRDDDYVFPSYREHAHAILRGSPPHAVMAELFGRVDGSSNGKGGSMHLFDVERHFLGARCRGGVRREIPRHHPDCDLLLR